jgi:hypothetical protein
MMGYRDKQRVGMADYLIGINPLCYSYPCPS